MWNGTAVNLNRNPTARNKIPIKIPLENRKENCPNPENNLANSSKLVIPVNPYMIEQPNRSTPEEKAPNRKYFIPASVENSELRFDAART